MVSIDKELFISYINTNEVVYQMADELVEVLHNDETKQKKDVISNVDASSCISIGTDMEKLIEMGFDELVNWSNSNDYLIRTAEETSNTGAVLDGDIDRFINAYLKMEAGKAERENL